MRALSLLTCVPLILLMGCEGKPNVEAELVKALKVRQELFCDRKILNVLFDHKGELIFDLMALKRHSKQLARYLKSNKELLVPIVGDRYRYKVTKQGRTVISSDHGVCFGDHVFHELIEFTEPAPAANGVIQTLVKFNTSYVPSEWYKSEGLPLGMPPKGKTFDREAFFKKTNKGWSLVQ